MMPISKRHAKRAGKRFEWRVRTRLAENSYMMITSAGSLGPCDLVAVKPDEVLFVQCKAGVAGHGTPGLLSPSEREGLGRFARYLNLGRDERLIGPGKAIVAFQIAEGRRHVLRFRELTGPLPSQAVDWWPDEVVQS